MTEGFRPNPISDREYHDARLVRLAHLDERIELELLEASGSRSVISLNDVAMFYADTVLEGNFIDYVMMHELSAANFEHLLVEFAEHQREWASVDTARAMNRRTGWYGKIFLGVRSSYGIHLNAVAGSVSETRL